jgi:hypothetical protein
MNKDPTPGVSEAEIEALIKYRGDIASFQDCPELDEIAAAVQGEASEEDRERAALHLKTCDRCAKAVLILQGLVSRRVLGLPRKVTSRSFRALFLPNGQIFSRLRLAVVALSVLLLCVGVAWYLGSKTTPGESRLQIKGSPDQLAVVFQRGANRFLAQPMDRLVPGDQLAFFYSAGRRGYLTVFTLDENGGVTPLVPGKGREQKSIEIEAGQEVPLADGGIVEWGQGCEWIVGVFSDRALDVEQVKQALQSTAETSAGCELKANIPRARSLIIFPVVR